MKEQVSINRVTKVVKGGKNMSFSALVVVGDPTAKVVGYGTGKAKEVPAAIKKGIEGEEFEEDQSPRNDDQAPGAGPVRFGSKLLKPAPAGKGVIAGGPVRAVIQAVGIPNVLTKSIGSRNPHNVVKATINALEQLRDQNAVGEVRGVGQEKFFSKAGRNMAGTIKIKLVKSPICTPEKHKVIVRSLGLKKINQVVERPDTPSFRGWWPRCRICWRSWSRSDEFK